MKRLIRILQALCVLLSMSEVVMVLIGRQQPVPERLTVLHLTDCALPCWIGIVPGQSTLAEARERLQAVYGDLSQYQLAFNTDAADKLVAVLGKQSPQTFILITIHARADSVVESVLLQLDFLKRDYSPTPILSPNQLTIGDLYTVLGPPSRAVLSSNTQQSAATVVMVYDEPDGGTMTFASSPAEPDWKLPATSIFFYADKFAFLGAAGTFRPWHGFASLDRYSVQLP